MNIDKIKDTLSHRPVNFEEHEIPSLTFTGMTTKQGINRCANLVDKYPAFYEELNNFYNYHFFGKDDEVVQNVNALLSLTRSHHSEAHIMEPDRDDSLSLLLSVPHDLDGWILSNPWFHAWLLITLIK